VNYFTPHTHLMLREWRTWRCKNVAARTNHIASGENPDFIDHCGRSILYGSCGGRIENMVVELVLFIAFVVAGGTVIVKAYEC
jgi:hypothetical protein